MKNAVFLTAFTLMLSFNSLSATFQNERGNGGGTVVCRNDDGNIKSIDLLDTYNWSVIENLSYENFYEKDQDVIDLATKRLAEIGSFKFLKELNSELIYMSKKMILLPSGAKVKQANDGLTIMELPKNCELIYIVDYRAVNEIPMIFVNRDIYNHELFTPTLKGTLKIHEAVYSALRKKYLLMQDSSVAQEITALLCADHLTNEQEIRLKYLTQNKIEEEINNIKLIASKDIKLESEVLNFLTGDVLLTSKLENGELTKTVFGDKAYEAYWYYLPSSIGDSFEVRKGDVFELSKAVFSDDITLILRRPGTDEIMSIVYNGRFSDIKEIYKMGIFEVLLK